MFDPTPSAPFGPRGTAAAPTLDAVAVAAGIEALGHLTPNASDAERIDRIRCLEELKSAAAAAQARETVALRKSVIIADADRGVPVAKRGKGVGAQVALARRESPHAGSRHVGFALALDEMPHTKAGLSTGRISEYRATLLVQETATLSREDRATVDRELMADPTRLEGRGNRAIAGEARKVAYRLDPGAAVRRARKAEKDRRVTIRPAPDTMVYLSALLPVKQGVSAFAVLSKAADSARASGDVRGRGQVMADTLVERVTGQRSAGTTNVEIQLVMTDRSLLQPNGPGDSEAHEPAYVPGYGVIPAGLARDWLVADHLDEKARVWVRRLYTHPRSGELVALDSRRRLFGHGLRRLIVTRDQFCRQPWCGAPIRHIDHAVPATAGGETTATNGGGRCEACNYAKEAPGWQARPRPGPDGRHRVEVITPTGHRYVSTPPALPGAPPKKAHAAGPDPRSRMEVIFSEIILQCA